MKRVRSVCWWVINTAAAVAISLVVGVAIMALSLLTGLAIFLGILRQK
jgi:hypothetical protein